MKSNTDTLVSITEANQNFSNVARLVDEKVLPVFLRTIGSSMSLWNTKDGTK